MKTSTTTKFLVDECGVSGKLDFEFTAYDWRAMELAIDLSKYCSEQEPFGYFSNSFTVSLCLVN